MPENQDLDTQENLDQTVETKDWREGLDVEVKNHPSLTNFKSPGDLAKSWISAQKLIGRDKIPVPTDKATKEDWDVVFDRLGRPKDKTGYAIPDIKLPEGYPAPKQEFVEELKAKAHELGMLPAQVEGLYKWFMDSEVNQFNQYSSERERQRGEAENALRKAWGKAFEQNYQIAEQAVNKYGSEEFVNKLKATGLSNDPDMIQFIASMAQNFAEDKITGKAPGLTLSPDEARAKIATIQSEAMKDKNHWMNNKRHPEYEYGIKMWKDLHEQAYPEENA